MWDIAVFKLQNLEIPVAKVGDAKTLKVGHLVLKLARGSEGDLRTAMAAVSVISGAWRSMNGGNIDQFIRPDITLLGNKAMSTTGYAYACTFLSIPSNFISHPFFKSSVSPVAPRLLLWVCDWVLLCFDLSHFRVFASPCQP